MLKSQTRVNVWGGDVIYRNNEYTIAIVVFECSFDRYKIVSPYLNFSVLYNKKNDFKPAYSLMGLYSLIPLTIFGFAHPEYLGSSATTIATLALIPLLITNSQHHFIITNVDSVSVSLVDMSLFIQNRSDYYQEKWIRVNPGFGVSASFYSERDSTRKSYNLVSVSIGIEKPFDIYKFKWEGLEVRYFLEIYKFF